MLKSYKNKTRESLYGPRETSVKYHKLAALLIIARLGALVLAGKCLMLQNNVGACMWSTYMQEYAPNCLA